jgi:hypothetical protein
MHQDLIMTICLVHALNKHSGHLLSAHTILLASRSVTEFKLLSDPHDARIVDIIAFPFLFLFPQRGMKLNTKRMFKSMGRKPMTTSCLDSMHMAGRNGVRTSTDDGGRSETEYAELPRSGVLKAQASHKQVTLWLLAQWTDDVLQPHQQSSFRRSELSATSVVPLPPEHFGSHSSIVPSPTGFIDMQRRDLSTVQYSTWPQSTVAVK